MSCDAPDLFRYLPARLRPEIVRRHLGPSSPWHLKPQFSASVDVLTRQTVRDVDVSNGKVRLDLACEETGQATPAETDHVICATGYRTDIDRLTFLDADLRAGSGRWAGHRRSPMASSPPSRVCISPASPPR